MYVAVVLNINFEYLLGKASAQIDSGIWILPHILDYSKWPKVSKKLEKSKTNWRGVNRTVRYIQKCNKKGTSDQNCECQIFFQNFRPTSQVTSMYLCTEFSPNSYAKDTSGYVAARSDSTVESDLAAM
jgi:hypothetical protein